MLHVNEFQNDNDSKEMIKRLAADKKLRQLQQKLQMIKQLEREVKERESRIIEKTVKTESQLKHINNRRSS